jgi:hypothetical protein
VLATYLAIATTAWGLQCTPRIDWAETVRVGSWPAQYVAGYPPGTELGAATSVAGCGITFSASWWRAHRHPRYRCDLVMHEVGHIALRLYGHDVEGPMSEPVGQAFDTCRRWYRTTEHFRRWRASFSRR